MNPRCVGDPRKTSVKRPAVSGVMTSWPERENPRVQLNDAAIAVVAEITAAYASPPTVPPEELVTQGTWDTRDLLGALAAVEDSPDGAFIERHFDSLPAFTPAGLRYVLPRYLIYSLEHPRSEATERSLRASTTTSIWIAQ